MKKRRQGSGHPAFRSVPGTDRRMLREFEVWLTAQEGAISAPSVDVEISALIGLLEMAHDCRVRLDRPAGVEPFVDALVRMAEEADTPETDDLLDASLAVLDDYLHFRLATDNDPGWHDAHDAVETALAALDPVSDVVAMAIADCDDLDPDTRRVALAATLPVGAVRELLDWIGQGRAVAPSGGARRSDIATVARLLGVDAVGVSKRLVPDSPPPLLDEGEPSGAPAPAAGQPEDGRGTIQARSMNDVPLLPGWWHALMALEVIERDGSRLRPGPAASAWLRDDLPPLETAEAVVGILIADTLVSEAHRMGTFGRQTAELAVQRLIDGVAPDHDLDWDGGGAGIFADALGTRVVATLDQLSRIGIVHLDDHGVVSVAPTLRGSVGRGVLATLALLTSVEPDDASQFAQAST